MEKNLPIRKRNRLQWYDYSTAGMYFLTVCTLDRKALLWDNVGATIGRPQEIVLSECGKIVEDAILRISQIYPSIFLENYVIMPNHIHLLVSIHQTDGGRPMVAPTIPRVVNQLKGATSKMVGFSIWQKSYYDHVIRNEQDYEEHMRYIEENPLKWELDTLYVNNE